MKLFQHLVLLSLVGVFATATNLSIAQEYSITDLGALANDNNSDGYSVNNSGEIAGSSASSPTGVGHGIFYDGSTLNDVGTLGGAYSISYGINSSGQVTGGAFVTGNRYSDAYIYSKADGIKDLGPIVGGTGSLGYGIDNSGQITGSWYDSNSNYHAFIYTSGTSTTLGTLGGLNSQGFGINNSGQVAGTSTLAGETASHAFFYNGNQMIDIGVLTGGKNSSALGVNDLGHLTGTSDIGANLTHAFFYNGSVMQDIGTLAGGKFSDGLGINNSDQIVGYSIPAGGPDLAFLYTNGTMTDLNTEISSSAGWLLLRANSISNNGFITGVGRINGQIHGYLLTPNAVPAPSSLVALGIGIGGLLVRRRGNSMTTRSSV